GVQLFGEAGEPHDVGEEHGGDAPLVVGGTQRPTAVRAEAGRRRGLSTAGRTDHVPEPTTPPRPPPKVRRGPRSQVSQFHAQLTKTEIRLRNPVRKTRWRASHANQAGVPRRRMPAGSSATARLRPMVAMMPRST